MFSFHCLLTFLECDIRKIQGGKDRLEMCHINQVFVCGDINIIDENPIKNNTLWISKDTGLDINIITPTTTTIIGKAALFKPQRS
jgi:hypothetical protein